MQPLTVAAILFSLLSFTTFSYFYAIPESIKGEKSHDFPGFWGAPTGEFNWCELNYKSMFYVAEPFNTFTSLFYLVPAVLHLTGWTAPIDYKRPLPLSIMLYSIAGVGIGSVLFHATLTYKMQLMDELPMYSLVISGTYMLFNRRTSFETSSVGNNSDYALGGVALACSGWFLCMCGTLLVVPRETTVHHVGRGLMSTSFSCMFLYIFFACNRAGHEVDKAMTEATPTTLRPVRSRQPHRGAGKDASALFDTAFTLFLIGIVSWIFDIWGCHLLQHLPYGMPYPQLHAIGWHLGTAVGLYHLLTLICLHDVVIHRGCAGSVGVEWYWCGALPVVRGSISSKQD